MKDLEVRKNFIEFLKTNLNYNDVNFIIEKRIEGKIIDLLICDKEKTIAIVEIKSKEINFEVLENQVKMYLDLISDKNTPVFLITEVNIYVLLNYGWQIISIEDFPNLEKLNKKY